MSEEESQLKAEISEYVREITNQTTFQSDTFKSIKDQIEGKSLVFTSMDGKFITTIPLHVSCEDGQVWIYGLHANIIRRFSYAMFQLMLSSTHGGGRFSLVAL
jgi:hypothetical protein